MTSHRRTCSCALATAMALFLLLPLTAPADAADYAVSPSGSDAADGSTTSPWLTIQKAANVAGAGDTVHVAAGSYAGFNILGTGTASARLTFLATPGSTIISTTQPSGVNSGINASGGQYITIDGFTLTPPAGSPFWGYGISFKSSPSTSASTWYYGNIVRNCTLNLRWANSPSDQVGSSMSDILGIFSSFQDGIQVYGNTVTGCSDSCIYTSNSARNYIVRNNVCHDFGAQAIHNNGDASQGNGYPGIQYNALIADNRCWNCTLSTLGQVLSFDGVQNSTIENNLVYNAYSKGISLYVVDAAAGSKNNLVVNNTIHTNATGGAALRIVDDSAGNTVFNNILITDNPSSGSVDMESGDMVGFACDYNVVGSRFYSDGSNLNFAAWQGYGFDAHSLQATAAQLFVSVAAGDYQLAAGSPASGAGIATLAGFAAPTSDIAGASRPHGAGIDIGAYQTSGTVGSTGSATGSGTGTSSTTATGTTGTASAGDSGASTAGATMAAGSGAAGVGSGSGTAVSSGSGGGGGGGCGLGGTLGMTVLLGLARLRRCRW